MLIKMYHPKSGKAILFRVAGGNLIRTVNILMAKNIRFAGCGYPE